jgi:cyclopropane-fatty-acyl-phospholipid synthase
VDALVRLAESGFVPDALLRVGIRGLLRERLRDESRRHGRDRDAALADFADRLRREPIAVETRQANEQHYEVPPPFFRIVLGPNLKYSCCWWGEGVDTLERAEEEMLRLTCERAGIADGMEILDLGCGWGSLSLWVARHYPSCRVLAVSNSAAQRESILADCRRLGLANVDAVTADMNRFSPGRTFDRVVSVEMFEHMRNYEELLRRIASWLSPGGRLFVHVFCHRDLAYLFETDGRNDWMARYFFSGGMMPSEGLLPSFRRDLETVGQWTVDGTHYEKTLLAWLALLDARRDDAIDALRPAYGREAARWVRRWRIFFLACRELFGYRGGSEWYVSHYLLAPVSR